MNIYVTRHGQTNWNIDNRVQGKADIDLNRKGVEQARDTKEQLNNEELDLIICSPLKRAMQTAAIINEGRNLPIIYAEEISERDFGELEGKRREDFDFDGFWSYKNNFSYECAENVRDFFNRIYAFLDKAKIKYAGKNILLVTHGGVSIPVSCYFNGIPEDDDMVKLILANCAVNRFETKE